MNNELKTKYKNDFKKVTLLFNEFDPCGLIKGGSPIDEYDCLTTQILSAFYEKKSRIEVKKLIIHEMEHHFGTPETNELKEPFKTKFNKNLDNVLDRIEIELLKSNEELK